MQIPNIDHVERVLEWSTVAPGAFLLLIVGAWTWFYKNFLMSNSIYVGSKRLSAIEDRLSAIENLVNDNTVDR